MFHVYFYAKHSCIVHACVSTRPYAGARFKCFLTVCPRISKAPWAGSGWRRLSNGKGVAGRARCIAASSRPLQVTPLTANDARWPFLITAMCVQALAPRAGNSTESTLGPSHATHTQGGIGEPLHNICCPYLSGRWLGGGKIKKHLGFSLRIFTHLTVNYLLSDCQDLVCYTSETLKGDSHG